MKFKRFNISTLVLMTIILLAAGMVYGQTKLLRFPDIHGNEVVFCYGGDLWKASVSGGLSPRLTAHPGQELFPKFSPDGKRIAFTGQYDGDEQVYVPLRGTNNIKGEWIIEGYGVDPDIEVENDPQSILQGRDPQLERGISEVLKKIEQNPRRLPKRPADPVKTK